MLTMIYFQKIHGILETHLSVQITIMLKMELLLPQNISNCFENLLLDKNNELKNRYLHIDFQSDIQSDNSVEQNVTLDELALLKIISENPSITQVQLAEKMGVTDRTIKRKMKLLQEKGLIQREGSKRNGKWIVLENTKS